ncbi:MAG TPA: hypothetical protein DHV85_03265, partial [Candidatus Accumulibacter sp.]|nr:hypothetical protein [Accumulibacter sp.]
ARRSGCRSPVWQLRKRPSIAERKTGTAADDATFVPGSLLRSDTAKESGSEQRLLCRLRRAPGPLAIGNLRHRRASRRCFHLLRTLPSAAATPNQRCARPRQFLGEWFAFFRFAAAAAADYFALVPIDQ